MFFSMSMAFTHYGEHHFTCLRLQHAAEFHADPLADTLTGLFYHDHSTVVQVADTLGFVLPYLRDFNFYLLTGQPWRP